MDLYLSWDDLTEAGSPKHRFSKLKPPPPGDPSMKDWLSQVFGEEASYGGRYSRKEECYMLGSGEPWATCTSWARMVARAIPGRSRVRGFWTDKNPDAVDMATVASGHDFAVVDDRYIVDGWSRHVEAIANQVVWDLQDPAERMAILRLYGNPSTWEDL